MAILQFKLSLLQSDPLVWRRIRVTDDYRMDRFHQVLQLAMGWDNKHLHEFQFGDRRIGMIFDDMDDYELENLEDENKLYLKDLNLQSGDELRYWYDFGDDWLHRLEVEEVREGDLELPVCIAGSHACPVEDCGGIGGHMDIIKFVKDPLHSDYPYLREWLPEDYDPAYFSLEEVNQELAKFGRWHRKHPRVVSTPWHQV